MTAAAARVARPARPVRPAEKAGRGAAYLRLVTTRRSSAAKTPFVVVVLGILTVGLLGLLALNTVLAQDAFTLHALQLQSRVLSDQEQSLQRDVEHLQSPESLADRATALGMVPGGPPAFLRLSDGKVLGAAIPAPAAPAPNNAVVTLAQQAASTAGTAVGTVKQALPVHKPSSGAWVLVAPVSAPTQQRAAGAAR